MLSYDFLNFLYRKSLEMAPHSRLSRQIYYMSNLHQLEVGLVEVLVK